MPPVPSRSDVYGHGEGGGGPIDGVGVGVGVGVVERMSSVRRSIGKVAGRHQHQQQQQQQQQQQHQQPLTTAGKKSAPAVSANPAEADASTSKTLSSALAPLPVSLVYSGAGRPSADDWGFPGYLTKEEFRVYEQFRDEVHRRGGAFRSTVFSFERANEEECYALCRWLRARKFALADTIQMVDEAASLRADAATREFYPDPHAALGVEACIYHSQYPQFYFGHAKGGYPLFISKAGVFNAAGLECVTTAEGILNFHWYDMMHDYVNQLRRQAMCDSPLKRYETVVIMDLDHLTSSQLTKRALNIVKMQSEIDSLCFPETLHRLVIINAPSFFSMTWRVMKNWVDERTASKVTILGTNKTKWMKKLLELVDVDNLPEDYGGRGMSTEKFIQRKTVAHYEEIATAAASSAAARQSGNGTNGGSIPGNPMAGGVRGKVKGHQVHLIALRSHASQTFDLSPNECMRLSFFTRSLAGCMVRLVSSAESGRLLPRGATLVRHLGTGVDEEKPTRVDLDDAVLRGPGRFKVKMDSNSGPFSVENFLLVGKVFTVVGGGSEDNVGVCVGPSGAIVTRTTNGGAGVPAVAPHPSSEDSLERKLLGDASSLCEQLCYNEGLGKDSYAPMSPIVDGEVVSHEVMAEVAPVSYAEHATPLPPPPSKEVARDDSPHARKDLSAPIAQSQDPAVCGKREETKYSAEKSDVMAATSVAIEAEHSAANPFMCGALFGVSSIREVLSWLWCSGSST